MFRLNRFARLAAFGLANIVIAAGAAADTLGPRVVGTGENGSVEYPVPSTNIVGGALTRSVGSGESATIEVIEVQHSMPGRLSRVVGSGESAQIIVMDPLPSMPIG